MCCRQEDIHICGCRIMNRLTKGGPSVLPALPPFLLSLSACPLSHPSFPLPSLMRLPPPIGCKATPLSPAPLSANPRASSPRSLVFCCDRIRQSCTSINRSCPHKFQALHDLLAMVFGLWRALHNSALVCMQAEGYGKRYGIVYVGRSPSLPTEGQLTATLKTSVAWVALIAFNSTTALKHLWLYQL